MLNYLQIIILYSCKKALFFEKCIHFCKNLNITYCRYTCNNFILVYLSYIVYKYKWEVNYNSVLFIFTYEIVQ